MSQENVEVVQAAYRAFNAGDREAALNLVAEDVVIEGTLLFDQGTLHGHEGAKAYREALREAWGESVAHPEEITEHGEHVLVMLRFIAKGTASGVTTDTPLAHLVTIQAGKIARFRVFRTREEVLEAVGLRE